MKTNSKAEAMTLFEQQRSEFLAHARDVAYHIGKNRGSVTIDDVKDEVKVPSWVNAKVLGAVFNQKDHNGDPLWEDVGRTKTRDKSSHGREIKVWRHVDFKSSQSSLFN